MSGGHLEEKLIRVSEIEELFMIGGCVSLPPESQLPGVQDWAWKLGMASFLINEKLGQI